MDEVKVWFYWEGGLKSISRHLNTAQLNALFLSGVICIDKVDYKIVYSGLNADTKELGIDIEKIDK